MKEQAKQAPLQQIKATPQVQPEPSIGGTATIEDHRAATVYQRKLIGAMDGSTGGDEAPHQPRQNSIGLPNKLKSGIESLSGHSMDDVKVHYNSSKPAQLKAHAFAQGTDIHLGPGQAKHLPHEAWHVVQQKQGRVKPTMQFKSNVAINDNAGLEKEADVMGNEALKQAPKPASLTTGAPTNMGVGLPAKSPAPLKNSKVAQLKEAKAGELETEETKENENAQEEGALRLEEKILLADGEQPEKPIKFIESDRRWYTNQAILMDAYRALKQQRVEGEDNTQIDHTLGELALAVLQSFAKTAVRDAPMRRRSMVGRQTKYGTKRHMNTDGTSAFYDNFAYYRSMDPKLLEALEALVTTDLGLGEGAKLRVVSDPFLMELLQRKFPTTWARGDAGGAVAREVNNDIGTWADFGLSLEVYCENLLQGFKPNTNSVKDHMLQFQELEHILVSANIPLYTLETKGEMPKSIYPNFQAFLGSEVFRTFRQLSEENEAPPYQKIYPRATAALLRGLGAENGGPDAVFQQKGIASLLQTSYLRMGLAMQDAVQYAHEDNMVGFMNEIEFLHDQIQMILAIAKPHQQDTQFAASIQHTLKGTPFGETDGKPTVPKIDRKAKSMASMRYFKNMVNNKRYPLKPQVHHKPSAMHGVSSVFAGLEAQKETNALNVLVLKDSYYETVGVDEMKGAIHNSPYNVSVLDGSKTNEIDGLNKGFEGGKAPEGKIDLYIAEFRHNVSKNINQYQVENLINHVDRLFKGNMVAPKFTVAIDITMEYIHSKEMQQFLNYFKAQIGKGLLNVVFFRSAQKFDMLGLDNYYGGYTISINNKYDYEKFNERMAAEEDQTPGLAHQGLTHLLKYGSHEIDAYHDALIKNTRYVQGRLMGAGLDRPGSTVVVAGTNDPLSVFIDITLPNKEMVGLFYTQIRDWAYYYDLKMTSKPSFGFPTTNIVSIIDKLRINPGLESRQDLDKYVDFIIKFNHLTTKKVADLFYLRNGYPHHYVNLFLEDFNPIKSGTEPIIKKIDVNKMLLEEREKNRKDKTPVVEEVEEKSKPKPKSRFFLMRRWEAIKLGWAKRKRKMKVPNPLKKLGTVIRSRKAGSRKDADISELLEPPVEDSLHEKEEVEESVPEITVPTVDFNGHTFQQPGTPRDGNCLFHGISQGLENLNIQNTPENLRTTIVGHYRTNPGIWQRITSGTNVTDVRTVWGDTNVTSFAQYIQAMETVGTWGNDNEIKYLAPLIGRDIVVITAEVVRHFRSDGSEVRYYGLDELALNQQHVYLLNVYNVHFEVLLPVGQTNNNE